MIMDLIYYCCFREKIKTDKTEAVLTIWSRMAEHEIQEADEEAELCKKNPAESESVLLRDP
jgi:hypothetical protein